MIDVDPDPARGGRIGLRARLNLDTLRRVFAIDLRSLAAFRIAVALLVLVDLTTRLPWVRLFYSDEGIQPRAFAPFHPATSPLSIHTVNGATAFQLALFAAALVAAGMLLVGWRTKLAVAVSYVHQTSLWWRNPTVLNAGDSVLILLLFWSLFLPLGARASLDARRRGQPLEATHVASVGSAGLLIQLASVYFFSALHKSIGLGWWEGTAVYYAVSHETMSRPFGLWLRQFRPAVAGLTWATLLWEFVGPPLLLSPWWTARLRLAVIGGFAALQLGIGMSMQLWLFPWIMTTALLPFVPAVVWDALDRLRGKPAAETPFVVWAGEDGSPGRRRLVAALAALALAYILMSNVERQIEWQTPRALSRVGRWFGLNQGWYMYAIARPYVVNLAVVGVLRVDGSRLALDDPEAGPHWQELAPLRDIYRGKLFLERLAYLSQESERAGFGDWVCRRWNGTASPSQQIASVELSAVRRSIEPDGSPSHRERELIWTQPCP